MPGIVTQVENLSVNVSPTIKCWRLVYNPTTKVVSYLWEGSGVTKTLSTIFVSDPTDGSPGSVTSDVGQAQCLSEITSLGLTYTPPKVY